MTTLLAADVGGTKSDLAILDLSQAAESSPLHRKRYRNKYFQNLDEILDDFLKGIETPDFACLAVAAVISNGTADLTNLDWSVSEEKIQHNFGFKNVTLINDLTAICSALPHLSEQELLTIQPGTAQGNGVRSVIAPGTGLGEGFLIEHDSIYFSQGSEGGHCDFAPVTHEQANLLTYMQKKHSAVSYELLCSGIGIPNIFEYLLSTDISRDHEGIDFIIESDDKTPPIIDGALKIFPCPLCQKTLDLFLEILGAEAGNLALKTFPQSGLFISGGILPRIVDQISFDGFLRYFMQKEKMEQLMQSFPIHLILKSDTALLGTVAYGQHIFREI